MQGGVSFGGGTRHPEGNAATQHLPCTPRLRLPCPGTHQMVEAKALRKWRSSRSVTWRPAARKASPVMAMSTVANLLRAGGQGSGWRERSARSECSAVRAGTQPHAVRGRRHAAACSPRGLQRRPGRRCAAARSVQRPPPCLPPPRRRWDCSTKQSSKRGARQVLHDGPEELRQADETHFHQVHLAVVLLRPAWRAAWCTQRQSATRLPCWESSRRRGQPARTARQTRHGPHQPPHTHCSSACRIIWEMVRTRLDRHSEPKDGPTACFSDLSVVPRVADSAPAGAKYLAQGEAKGRGKASWGQAARGATAAGSARQPMVAHIWHLFMSCPALTTARWLRW